MDYPYVFYELIVSDSERHIYIGRNFQAIMDDTEDGTRFSRTVPITRFNPLRFEQVQELKLPQFTNAIIAMQKGDACYYIGSPG